MEGKGRPILTGKLGDVMQESAQAADELRSFPLSSIRLAERLSTATSTSTCTYLKALFPKDGPSAGITICTSIVQRAHSHSHSLRRGMTGEITLRGKILPIGGVKEKLLAAHRMGLRTILLPKDNEKDLADIPQEILASLTVNPVETMDAVLQVALERPIVPAAVATVAGEFAGAAEKDKSLTN
jgi:ATP-dependent Lon protease